MSLGILHAAGVTQLAPAPDLPAKWPGLITLQELGFSSYKPFSSVLCDE